MAKHPTHLGHQLHVRLRPDRFKSLSLKRRSVSSVRAAFGIFTRPFHDVHISSCVCDCYFSNLKDASARFAHLAMLEDDKNLVTTDTVPVILPTQTSDAVEPEALSARGEDPHRYVSHRLWSGHADSRGLRMRHVQLIAISGSIGAALFVSIGSPLTKAGPLGLLIGVSVWTFVVWTASDCLIEMTSLLPLDGGFISFASRFVDRGFGMALGWNVSPSS